MSSWRSFRTVTPPLHGELKLLKQYLRIVGTDPRATGLKIIDVPLDQKPNALWLECLRRPGILVPSFHGTEVHDSTIRIRADAQHPEHDLNTLEEYVRNANQVYLARVAEMKKQEEQRRAKEAKEAEYHRSLEERLRKGG